MGSERWVANAKRLAVAAATPAFRVRNRLALGHRYRAAAAHLRPEPLVPPPGPILFVHPHVDDETIASGGVLLWCADHGRTVDLVYTTDSSAGGVGSSPAARARTRRSEAEQLARRTAIRSVRVLSGVNERLAEAADRVADELADVLRQERYAAAFVVGPMDAHHEHRTSARLISAAFGETSFDGAVYVGENSNLLPEALVTHALVMNRSALSRRDRLLGLFRSQRSMGFEVYHDLARAKRHLVPGAHAAELYHRTDAAGYARLVAAVDDLDADRAFPHRIGNSWSLSRAVDPLDPQAVAALLRAARGQ